MSIPASQIVSVTPSVLSAGGNPLALHGLILSEAAALPIGAPTSFPDAASVGDYFGPSSVELDMATVYFNGFDNSTTKPSALLFSRYASSTVAAFNRGGTNALTSASFSTATSAGMTIVVDGTTVTVSACNLTSGTSSLAAVAALVTAACTPTIATVTYDTVFNAFLVTSKTTGSVSSISYASDLGAFTQLATVLGLKAVSGATLSQGADVAAPEAHMSAILPFTQNWVSFASTFQPGLANKKLFATWANDSTGRYLYAPWDTDANAYATPTGLSLGEWLTAQDMSGTAPIFTDTANGPKHAAFVLGTIASIDFTENNGRITLKFKSQTGLTAYVTDATKASALAVNGYNFYGAYATANDGFNFFANGVVSGPYLWIDAYINAVWLNNQLQLSEMDLLTNMKSIPYNDQGYTLIRAAAQDPINAALLFGAIRGGVPLSASQIAQVNAAAGLQIDQTLSTVGYYFQVNAATAQVRALRQSPPCKLWYMDGGSVHQLNINSINIQ